MNGPEDELFSLLDAWEAPEMDIEAAVLRQVHADGETEALRSEVNELRAEVAILRREMESMRMLLAQRLAPPVESSRGLPLLPYRTNDNFSLFPEQGGTR